MRCVRARVRRDAQSWAWDDGTVPFVVSPPEVVDRMLRLAEPRPGELSSTSAPATAAS
jgi:hypothetical protein